MKLSNYVYILLEKEGNQIKDIVLGKTLKELRVHMRMCYGWTAVCTGSNSQFKPKDSSIKGGFVYGRCGGKTYTKLPYIRVKTCELLAYILQRGEFA